MRRWRVEWTVFALLVVVFVCLGILIGPPPWSEPVPCWMPEDGPGGYRP